MSKPEKETTELEHGWAGALARGAAQAKEGRSSRRAGLGAGLGQGVAHVGESEAEAREGWLGRGGQQAGWWPGQGKGVGRRERWARKN